MESSSKLATAVVIPTKSNEKRKCIENIDPNVCSPRPRPEFHNPLQMINSRHNTKRPCRNGKSNLNQLASRSAKRRIGERKFVIAKKKSRSEEEEEESDSSAATANCDKCEKAAGTSKCLCLAYENLTASREEFFNNQNVAHSEVDFGRVSEFVEIDGEGRKERSDGELRLKRNRERLMEAARQSVPEPGSGRVMHLVKAFEKLLMISKSLDFDETEGDNKKKAIKWALPGLQQPTRFSSSSSDFSLASESLGFDSLISFSSDCCQGSLSTRTSAEGRKSRPSSSEHSRASSTRPWKTNQQKANSRKPFVLITEQSGRCKEEEFMKKLQQKLEEEEKLRMPVAQGLPKTTDEPEILVKPPVKESTKPVNLMLHTDTRAVERAEFDNLVAKKMNLIEQYRVEMERQQMLSEEEEIRRLRKELVHKAQPMPHFERPFIPRRSVKQLTIPKEPKFHLPQHRKIKCYVSLNELSTQLE